MKRLLALILALAASPLLSTCTGARPAETTQRTPWTTVAQVALVTAAHLIDGADAFAAQRYTAATQVPGASLDAVDRQYAPISIARRVARPALQAAQSAIAVVAQLVRDHADIATISTGACQALALLRAAQTAVTQLAAAFSEAGLRDAPSFANTINALSSTLSGGPLCPGSP